MHVTDTNSHHSVAALQMPSSAEHYKNAASMNWDRGIVHMQLLSGLHKQQRALCMVQRLTIASGPAAITLGVLLNKGSS